jgi:hypothetical protein
LIFLILTFIFNSVILFGNISIFNYYTIFNILTVVLCFFVIDFLYMFYTDLKRKKEGLQYIFLVLIVIILLLGTLNFTYFTTRLINDIINLENKFINVLLSFLGALLTTAILGLVTWKSSKGKLQKNISITFICLSIFILFIMLWFADEVKQNPNLNEKLPDITDVLNEKGMDYSRIDVYGYRYFVIQVRNTVIYQETDNEDEERHGFDNTYQLDFEIYILDENGITKDYKRIYTDSSGKVAIIYGSLEYELIIKSQNSSDVWSILIDDVKFRNENNPVILYQDNKEIIDIDWIDDTIKECAIIENVEYMGSKGYKPTIIERNIKALHLIPGLYKITYLDGSSKYMRLEKDGEYNFSKE